MAEAKKKIYEDIVKAIQQNDFGFSYGVGNICKWLPKYSLNEIKASLDKYLDDRLTKIVITNNNNSNKHIYYKLTHHS